MKTATEIKASPRFIARIKKLLDKEDRRIVKIIRKLLRHMKTMS